MMLMLIDGTVKCVIAKPVLHLHILRKKLQTKKQKFFKLANLSQKSLDFNSMLNKANLNAFSSFVVAMVSLIAILFVPFFSVNLHQMLVSASSI